MSNVASVVVSEIPPLQSLLPVLNQALKDAGLSDNFTAILNPDFEGILIQGPNPEFTLEIWPETWSIELDEQAPDEIDPDDPDASNRVIKYRDILPKGYTAGTLLPALDIKYPHSQEMRWVHLLVLETLAVHLGGFHADEGIEDIWLPEPGKFSTYEKYVDVMYPKGKGGLRAMGNLAGRQAAKGEDPRKPFTGR